MKASLLPDVDYLKECFELDPLSPSYLKWNKDRPISHFASVESYKIWKAKESNKQITNLNTDGYYIIYTRTINNKVTRFKVHRVIYAIANNTNDFQNLQVDHIDCNKLNNNPQNLRLATNTQNQLNRGKQKNNTSGHKNIFFHKKCQKYTCSIRINKKQTHIGVFDSLELAIEARDKKMKEVFGDFYKI